MSQQIPPPEPGVLSDGRPRRIRNIAELARLAGVSAGTVSRALANVPLVSKDTRDRIQALARAHNFRPNQMARRLRTQKTGVVGLVIPMGHDKRQHVSDPFFMTMLGHIADELTETGHDLMLTRVIPDDPEWLERIVDSGMLDGVLMLGQSDQFDTIERVAADYRPLVVWGSHRDGQRHCSVGTDNVEGGRLAARQLLEHGAKSIAFFGETRGIEVEQRLAGVREEIARSDTPVDLIPVTVPFSADTMGAPISDFLSREGGKIDGIVSASDTIAMVTIRYLHELGMRVPTDVRVVGFDDLPFATQTAPPLTTVRQDLAGGARAMVERLKARLAGDITPSLVMAPTLVVRASA